MLALCSMLRHTYYAQNYAGIIHTGLLIALPLIGVNIWAQSSHMIIIFYWPQRRHSVCPLPFLNHFFQFFFQLEAWIYLFHLKHTSEYRLHTKGEVVQWFSNLSVRLLNHWATKPKSVTSLYYDYTKLKKQIDKYSIALKSRLMG